MGVRQQLFDLAGHFGLMPSDGQVLHTAAGLHTQPRKADRWAVPVLAVMAAALGGFGVILWIAANWGLWSRPTHFVLLGTLLLACCVGSWALSQRRNLSIALGLLGLATLGGLLAYFGQTYQTGADPWQLFALWAALSLPLCLGLCHSVPWMPWSLIANTAISLWAWNALERRGSIEAFADLQTLSWALGASSLVSLALAPGWHRLTGGTALSHRVASFWTVLLTGGLSLSQFLMHNGNLLALLPGLFLLGAALGWYASRQHFDVLLLSACTLAMLVLLFTLLAERLLGLHELNAFSMMVLGLVAMLALAGAVAWIMRRQRGFYTSDVTTLTPGKNTPSQAAPNADDGLPAPLAAALDAGIGNGWWSSRQHGMQALRSSHERPWAVVLLTALGAWLAVGPFVAALTLLASGTSEIGLALGLLLAGGALALLRRSALPMFMEQLAYALLVTGIVFIALGTTGLWNERAALWVLVAVLCLLVWALREPWLQVLLGAALCTLLPMAIISLLGANGAYSPLEHAWSFAWLPTMIAAAWPVAMLRLQKPWLGLPLVRHAGRREAFCAGWALTVLVQQAASAGMTFMLAGVAGGAMGMSGWSSNVLTEASGLEFWQWWLPLSSGLFALAGYVIGARRWPLLRHSALGLLAVLLVIAAWYLPSLGIPLCFLATAAVTRRWRLAVAAALAVGWVIGAIYYQTNYLLIHKALSLLGLAGVVGGLALWLHRTLDHSVLLSARISAAQSGMPQHPLAWRRHLLLLAPLATAGVLVPGLLRNESLIREGERLLVKLAPVDPRSLMQGDYMALAFELVPAQEPQTGSLEPEAPARYAVFRRDPTGRATILRLEYHESRPALAPDERRVRLGHRHGRPLLVTDAWHFKEGTGERWTQAAYGEFRLLPDGRALLVGLADDKLQPIQAE